MKTTSRGLFHGAVCLLFGGAALAQSPPGNLPIPAIDELTRIDDETRASRGERQLSCYLLATQPHAVAEDGYMILTDHRADGPLASLRRLAKARGAEIVEVEDLSAVRADAPAWTSLRAKLVRAAPRFVAIAPRPETYDERTVWSMWDLLCGLDADPELDVFPGFLVAPDPETLDALITRSIEHRPQTHETFRPFVLGQVVDGTPLGIRSLQKVGIMRRLFAALGHETPALVILQAKAAGERRISAEDVWYEVAPNRKEGLKALPAQARKAIEGASLVLTYGHGTPGVVCSIDVGAFGGIDMTGKVVMSGSCFSGAPREWDSPLPRRIQDGPERERFLTRAVQNGATVAFGHMKFNGGFPFLYPVLEHWLGGGSVGEGYQRIVNAVLARVKETPADVLGGKRRARLAGNMMLYVVIGDPALKPFEGLAEPKNGER